MDRRKFLAACTALGVGGLAGCSALGITDSEPTTAPPTTAPPTTDSAVQRELVLVDEVDLPEEHELTVDATLSESLVTDDHPARLEITITNEGEARLIYPGNNNGGECMLFAHPSSGSEEPPGLWLHHSTSPGTVGGQTDRWVEDEPANESRIGDLVGCPGREYEPDESVPITYEIWWDYQVAGYFEPGTYRFEEEIRIWDETTDVDTGNPDAELTWGFSLDVRK